MPEQTHLTRFRVQNFRSIQDSGWIEVNSVAALVGVNESGKTNLLLPLWKLKPARDGEIDLIADAPRKRFTEIRANPKGFIFIEADFLLSEEAAESIAAIAKTDVKDVQLVRASRGFDGATYIVFPDAPNTKSIPSSRLKSLLDAAKHEIGSATPSGKGDEVFQGQAMETIDGAIAAVAPSDNQSKAAVEKVSAALKSFDLATSPAKSTIKPKFEKLLEDASILLTQVTAPTPNQIQEARVAAWEALPAFIYYSTYGNLDSEIYLPHVIENLEREDLRGKEAAKARTLRVLFDFVGLKPAEILSLGEEKPAVPGKDPPAQAAIEAEARKKKEREVLLQSASATLTTKFRDWWKQGTYRFRLQADGRHFRIWVSDDLRPDEIELEGRSTGLQWFLSFYLVFLVEKNNAHQDCILLLDEPGQSLHPLAQKDLIAFFQSLAESGQILYTTHSPFLVDSNRLDDVLAVYVDGNGLTRASTDLRVTEIGSDRDRSIYPVHAAVGLSVSDIILQGCDSVVVEGPSDQIYLAMMKRSLNLGTERELVFIPAKGARSIKALTAILSGTSSALPVVLLDSDAEGRNTAEQLRKELYAGSPSRVITLEDCGFASGHEIEDVIPRSLIGDALSREYRQVEAEFAQLQKPTEPVVPQIKTWAASAQVELSPGWKVGLARRVRQRAEQGNIKPPAEWQKLFAAIAKALKAT